jgi:hypothetical protein
LLQPEDDEDTFSVDTVACSGVPVDSVDTVPCSAVPVPDVFDELEDVEAPELAELDCLEMAVDDDPELDVEPDDPDAPPQDSTSHLPVTGFGDVPAGPFFAHLSGVPPGSQAATIDPFPL